MSCVKHLENINFRTRHLFLVFYENLTESRVSRSVCLSYVQRFQGWGVERMVDGEFVKYDGLSGNHVLFFQALDAFLGMDRFKNHSFHNKVKEHNDMRIEGEFTKIVNQLKVRFFPRLF